MLKFSAPRVQRESEAPPRLDRSEEWGWACANGLATKWASR